MAETFARRASRFLARVRWLGAAAALVTKHENVRYLSGFPGEDAWLIVAPRKRILITDSRFAEEAAVSCPSLDTLLRSGPIVEAAAAVLDEVGGPVFFEAEHLSADKVARLRKALGNRTRIEARLGLVEKQRLVKDASEIAAIRRAVAVAEKGFYRALAEAHGDESENAFAAAIEYQMRLEGAEGAAFSTIAAGEPLSSFPHARPTNAPITAKGTLLVDWGARLEGYNSDLTRVVATGKVSRRIREIYRIVQAARKAALRRMKPGVAASSVDAAARKVISQAGYGEYFGHGLGHGVGLEVHEGPALSPQSATRLVAGMVLTVEPGIYLPGEGGVRLEDMVVVTASGCKVITRVGRDPAALGARLARKRS